MSFSQDQAPPVNDRTVVASARDLENGGADDDDYDIHNNEDGVEQVSPVRGDDGSETADGTDVDTAVDEEPDDESYGERNANEEENKEDAFKKQPDNKQRKRLAIGGAICLAFLILIIVLAILFTPDTGSARSVLEPETESPTITPPTSSPIVPTPEPTSSPIVPTPEPTDAPTEQGETPSPIPPPTPSPVTLPPTEISISRLPCAEIFKTESATSGNFGDNNFKNYSVRVEGENRNVSVCGDTYGPDPNRPNRNVWSVSLGRRNCPAYSYEAGLQICNETVGARFCTLNEYIDGAATGTGCGGDRVFVYSNTDCIGEDDGLPGKIMFDLGLRDPRLPFTKCQTDLSTPSIVRCCGDNY